MKTTYFMYKCRMCGNTFGDAAINATIGENVLNCIICGIDHAEGVSGVMPGLLARYNCLEYQVPSVGDKTGLYGVADLIGIKTI